MQVTLAHVGPPARSHDSYDSPVRDYLKRCSGLMRCDAMAFRSEKALFEWLDRQRGRTQTVLLLLDGGGRQMTSKSLAEWLGKRRDEGPSKCGFCRRPRRWMVREALAEAKRRGGLLSLGPMTLAHQLARLVVAEQLYRACTILTGHPYHTGH